MSEWYSIFQTVHPQSLQDIGWEWVNMSGFWTGYAVICGVGALFLFTHLLHQFDRNLLTVARMFWLSGLIVGAFVPFNSACQPLSAALMSTAGSMIAVLMTTNWCYRIGTPGQKIRAILGEWKKAPR